MGLLALALQAQGVPAVSYGGWQMPIKTDSAYTKARIVSIDDTRVRADLAAGNAGGARRFHIERRFQGEAVHLVKAVGDAGDAATVEFIRGDVDGDGARVAQTIGIAHRIGERVGS